MTAVSGAGESDRLDVVSGVLWDMQEAAWESMERNDFAETTTEFARLAYLKQVGPSVEADRVAVAPTQGRVDMTRRLAHRRPRSRGIERSR